MQNVVGKVLRVRNWDATFENFRTRSMQHTARVSIPNKLDNEGYIELISHDDGAAHFGAWIALVEIASRCDPRGTLVRKDGTPHTAATMARLSRIPVKIFEAVLPRLLSIGWIEALDGDSVPEPRYSVIQAVSGQYPPTTEGKERKERKEGQEGSGDDSDGDNPFNQPKDLWEEFKQLYPPNRLDEQFACQLFISHNDQVDIIDGLRRAVASEDWTKSNGRYVPWASKFISESKYTGFRNPEGPAAPAYQSADEYVKRLQNE